MSNWDDDDFMGGGDNTNAGGNWDDDGNWGESAAAAPAADNWDCDDWETEKPKETKPTGPSKKDLKQIAKEKEDQEKAEKAAKQKAIADEQRRLENDPEYRQKKREQERKNQEQGELDSISDLFGTDAAKPTPQVFRKEANPERARELAAMTGFGDGAGDYADESQKMGKDDKWDEIAHVDRKGPAPGSLDQLPFETDADIIAFTKVLAAKIKAVGNTKSTNNSQTMSKVLLVELVRAIGPVMKAQDVDEVMRVATVVKNDLNKKTQNPKKKQGKKVNLHDNGRHYSDEEDFM